jgi:hypothetical protein
MDGIHRPGVERRVIARDGAVSPVAISPITRPVVSLHREPMR